MSVAPSSGSSSSTPAEQAPEERRREIALEPARAGPDAGCGGCGRAAACTRSMSASVRNGWIRTFRSPGTAGSIVDHDEVGVIELRVRLGVGRRPTTSMACAERGSMRCEQLGQLVVPGRRWSRRQLVAPGGCARRAPYVHRDVGDLVVEERDAEARAARLAMNTATSKIIGYVDLSDRVSGLRDHACSRERCSRFCTCRARRATKSSSAMSTRNSAAACTTTRARRPRPPASIGRGIRVVAVPCPGATTRVRTRRARCCRSPPPSRSRGGRRGVGRR